LIQAKAGYQKGALFLRKLMGDFFQKNILFPFSGHASAELPDVMKGSCGSADHPSISKKGSTALNLAKEPLLFHFAIDSCVDYTSFRGRTTFHFNHLHYP
jgi:hypothetical protein